MMSQYDMIGELNPFWRRLVIAGYAGWSLYACILVRKICEESTGTSGTLGSTGKVTFAILDHTFPIFVFLLISIVMVLITVAWSEWHYRRLFVNGVGIGLVFGVILWFWRECY